MEKLQPGVPGREFFGKMDHPIGHKNTRWGDPS
jgi:hypothetical protein